MKIVLSGYYGFDNAGDEALLSAITSSIRRLAPEAEFVVFSGSPEKTASRHGVRAVYYKSPGQVWRELRDADLLISGGGSIFQDVTSARSLPYYISVVALAKLLGKPVIFYAQGVGPINRRTSKWLMGLVANRVDIITLRDEKSLQLMLELGVARPPLLVTADPVFSLQPTTAAELKIETLLAGQGLADKSLVGVAVRRWQPLDGYQANLAKLLDELAGRGYQIIFVPMAYPEDVNEARRVAGLMQAESLVLDEHLQSQEHLALIARMNLMIAVRLHALIFAANRGVPFAGISYDPKVEAFLSSFNLAPLPADYEAMLARVEDLLDAEHMQNEISRRAEEMRAQAEDNARLALSLVKGQNRGGSHE
jgi:polysaccharide pyruvyl transferase CsaB